MSDMTNDELLDRLCWLHASDAERFFPPDETADECIEHFEEAMEEGITSETQTFDGDEYVSYDNEAKIRVTDKSRGSEYGAHGRALNNAVRFFKELENAGLDPKARAERYNKESIPEDEEVPDLDWTWYEATPRLGQDQKT